MASKRSRATFEADLQAQQSPYVVYGTPLPPLDPDVRDDGSYVPIWKQEVTDDRGRKRLHGAFTGGFSAGYFNTVGSKEGWTPSTFVSSRQKRMKDAKQNVQQRPEDFMDEEDIREAEEAKKLQTADSFAGFGSTEDDSRRLGGLMDVLKIEGETMGVKLLKRMGWREGQGIGPKVRRIANLGDTAESRKGGSAETHLFAPENPSMVAFVRKTDHKGLGFEGEARLDPNPNVESNEKSGLKDEEDVEQDTGLQLTASNSKKKKKDPKRGGFGVGILNDTGSDDEDPYQMGPQISYNRVIGGERKKKKKIENGKPVVATSNPLLKAKPVFISKKTAAAKANTGFQKCHDGRLPLEGFVLSSNTDDVSSIQSQDGKYPPPDIPKDWKSSKTSITSKDTSKYQSTAEVARASSLDPKSRAALLGEAQLPGKSVFDFLTPSARDRIVTASGRNNLPAALGEAAPKGFENTDEEILRDLWDLVPKLDSDVAIQALGRGVGGWMPYAEDESKRSRYRAYLELRAGLRHSLPERAPNMSKDNWGTELQGFARAAQVFRPVTGMMASRFTSSTSQPSLASDAPDSTVPTDSLLSKPAAKLEDPAEVAARMGMYGPLTRSVQQFYPTRLLCKRFNVKPPAHVQLDPGDAPSESGASSLGMEGRVQSSGHQPGANTKLDLVSKDVMNRLLIESGGGGAGFGVSSEPDTATEKPKEIVVDAERNEALEAERPGEAVFRAIFGSDDEDDD